MFLLDNMKLDVVCCGVCILVIFVVAELEPRKIIKLGKQLEEMLLYSKRHDGNVFMEKLHKYNEYLEIVLGQVEEETSLGNKLYKALERDHGPPHLKCQVYNILMTRMMNITLDQVDEVESTMEKTKETWNTIKYIVNNRTLGRRVNDTSLPELGLSINRTLSKPWGTGLQLIRDIYVYFEELDGIRKEMKKGILSGLDPVKDLPQQFKKYQEVNETGGPIHLQSSVNIKMLSTYYKWGTENISEFYELLQFTKDSWDKFQRLFKSEEERPPLTIQEKIKMHLWKEKG